MRKTNARDPERIATISFRTSQHTKKLVEAVAAKRAMLPSDWLREALETAVWVELGFDPPEEVNDG